MLSIRIPDQYLDGFDAIMKLNDELYSKLDNALSEISVGDNLKKLQDAINNSLNLENSSVITNTILSLGNLLASEESSIDSLASDLSTSFNDQKEKIYSNDQIGILKKRLASILMKCQNMKITFKAFDLQSESSKSFNHCRIITDIRLVFDDDIENSERNALILHTLKIKYLSESKYKEFYVTLDNSDLDNLKKQIERALKKEELIKNGFKDVIKFINISEEINL